MLEARIDHTRVVQIVSRADHLPLIKDYLLAVQKVIWRCLTHRASKA